MLRIIYIAIFWQGAASGALGSIGASIYGGGNLWVTMAIGSVSGGIGAVIGGARSAEDILFGMATGAIVGALNHWMHKGGDPDPDDVKLTNRIRRKMENSPTVQRISQSVFDQRGEANIALQILDGFKIKIAGTILKVIDGIKIYVNEIGPWVDWSLKQEGCQNRTIPFRYEPGKNSNGYMENGVWHSTGR